MPYLTEDLLIPYFTEDPDTDQKEDVKDTKLPPQAQKRQRQVAISGESVKQSAVDIDYTEYPKDAE